MKKTNKFLVLLLLLTNIGYSQKDTTKYNDTGLTRLTFGIHVSSYKNADEIRANPQTNNIGGFDTSNSQGFFINYKVLKYRNHSLKAGLFLNSLRHELWYHGYVTDIMTGNLREVSSRPDPFVEKMLSIEYCIDYSFLMKINNNLFLDLSVGISQERNQSYEIYTSTFYFAEDFNLIPYQNPASSVYLYERKFMRTNFAAALGYKTEVGMFNLGVKYSVAKTVVARGNYDFFEPGVDGNDQGYGFIEFSGDYIGATLSFTPSKTIFKKKK